MRGGSSHETLNHMQKFSPHSALSYPAWLLLLPITVTHEEKQRGEHVFLHVTSVLCSKCASLTVFLCWKRHERSRKCREERETEEWVCQRWDKIRTWETKERSGVRPSSLRSHVEVFVHHHLLRQSHSRQTNPPPTPTDFQILPLCDLLSRGTRSFFENNQHDTRKGAKIQTEIINLQE